MASNEEYLDNLLKNITAETEPEPSAVLPEEGREDFQKDIVPAQTDVDELDMSDMDALLGAIADQDEADAPALQDVMQMSEDDIERMLEASQNVSPNQSNGDDVPDLDALLGSSGDDDLQEITSLLEKSDQNEAVDKNVMSMLQDNTSQAIEAGGSSDDLEGEPEANVVSKREKRAAEKKAKREAKKAARLEKKNKKKRKEIPEENTESEGNDAENTVQEDAAGNNEEKNGLAIEDLFFNSEEEPPLVPDVDDDIPEKKPAKKGFFARIIDFLTEEDEAEEQDSEEAASLNLSDENTAILEEMNKKGKGDSKKKKKNNKKKGKEKVSQDGEEQEEEQKGKKKKEKKPKKERKPKEEVPIEEGGKPEKKLTIKKIIPIAVIAASLMAVIIIGSLLTVDYSSRKNAAEAFYSGNYQECYQDLIGKQLNETEEVMFYKSEAILRMRLYQREYEYLAQQGMKVEALDNLILTVTEYPKLLDEAVKWNASDEVTQIYQQILQILSDTYHLTEAQAQEIAAEPDDVKYTKAVMAVAAGNDYTQWKDESDRASMQDILPEENEIPDTSFVENNS